MRKLLKRIFGKKETTTPLNFQNPDFKTRLKTANLNKRKRLFEATIAIEYNDNELRIFTANVMAFSKTDAVGKISKGMKLKVKQIKRK